MTFAMDEAVWVPDYLGGGKWGWKPEVICGTVPDGKGGTRLETRESGAWSAISVRARDEREHGTDKPEQTP